MKPAQAFGGGGTITPINSKQQQKTQEKDSVKGIREFEVDEKLDVVYELKKVKVKDENGESATETRRDVVGIKAIKVLAVMQDIDDAGENAIKFGWKTRDGIECEHACWLDEAIDDKSRVATTIYKRANGGIADKIIFRAFVNYFVWLSNRSAEIPTHRCTSRAGFDNDFTYFTANEFSLSAIPDVVPPTLIGGASAATRWVKKGDRDEYMNFMSHVLTKNPGAAFIAGFAVAGSIVKLVGAENFSLSIVGESSLGKTLVLKLCQAMRGEYDRFASFNGTAGSLQSVVLSGADSCTLIDETGESGMTKEQKENFIYSISQGKERGRLRRNGDDFSARESKKSHYTIIFTGELGMLTSDAQGGASVRNTEILVTKENPIWLQFYGMEKTQGAEAAQRIEKFISKNSGWLMPEAIDFILKNAEDVKTEYDMTLAMLRNTISREGLATDNKSMRKIQTTALAMTGCWILGQVLGCRISQVNINGEQSDFGSFVSNAITDSSASQTISEDEKYENLLMSIPVTFADRLYDLEKTEGDSKQDVKRPIGAIRHSDRKTEIRILTKEMQNILDDATVDSNRFFGWATKNEFLQLMANGPNCSPTRIKRLKINSILSAPCYQFFIKNDTQNG